MKRLLICVLLSLVTVQAWGTTYHIRPAATEPDSSGNKRLGIANALVDSTGEINNSYDFNGTTSFLNAGTDCIGTGAVTVTAWIRPTGWGENNAGAIAVNGRFFLNISNSRVVAFSSDGYTVGGAYSAVDGIALNSWYHVAVTRTAAGVANIYINGTLSGSANQNSGTPAAATTQLWIGNRSAQDRTFDGLLDDLRIYGGVLTAAEVDSVYDKAFTRTDSLRLHYAMDQTNIDMIGNNTTGNGSAATPWATLAGVMPSKWGSPIAAGDTLKCYAGAHGSVSFTTDAASETFIIGDYDHTDKVSITRLDIEDATNWTVKAVHVGLGSLAGGHVYLHGDARNITLRNCHVGNTLDWSSWTNEEWADSTGLWKTSWTVEWHGVRMAGDVANVVIDSCTIYGVAHGVLSSSSAGPIFVTNNIINGYTIDGITANPAKGYVVEGNLIKNGVKARETDHCDGIQLARSTSLSDSIYIRNNIVITQDDNPPLEGAYGSQGINGFDDSDRVNVVIENNVVATGHQNSIGIERGWNVIIRNNLVVHPTDSTGGIARIALVDRTRDPITISSGIVANNIAPTYSYGSALGDSLTSAGNIDYGSTDTIKNYVTDWNGGDYTPLSTAGTRDAGDATDEDYYSASDILGVARDAAPDVGPYEYADPLEEGELRAPRTFYLHSVLGSNSNSGHSLALAKQTYAALAESLIARDVVRAVGTFAETVLAYRDSIRITAVPDSLPPVFGGKKALDGWAQAGNAGGASIDSVLAVSGNARTTYYVRSGALNFTGARDSTSASTSSTYGGIGYWTLDAARVEMDRLQLMFIIPGTVVSANVDSMTLMLDGRSLVRTYNDSITALAGTMPPTNSNGNYILFDGRTVGSAHTGIPLLEWWNMSRYSNYRNYFQFTAAGIDSGKAAIGDTLKLMLMGAADYRNVDTVGSNDAYLSFNVHADSTQPYLYIYSSEPTTLVENVYVRAATGTEQSMTRLWNGATLMSKQADGAVLSANNQWCLSADKDSVYVYYSAAADTGSVSGNGYGANVLDLNEKRGVTVHHVTLHGGGVTGHVVYADGSLNNLWNLNIVDGLKGIYALGDTIDIRNVAFRIIDAGSDSVIICDTGTDVVYTHLAFDIGSDYQAPASPAPEWVLAADIWADADYTPSEALRDKGVDVGLSFNGSAPEIGAIELAALLASGAYRRGFGGGQWGVTTKRKWGRGPW